MKKWMLLAVLGLVLSVAQGQAAEVEVKNVHLCCPACVRAVGTILKKVEGISDAKCDQAGKTVSFKAADDKATAAALKALMAGGFYGKATADGKAVKVDAPAASGTADSVTVEQVHVCCKSCQTAINDLFKDAKVTYKGSGAIRTVTVAGKGLDKGKVLETLRSAGFNGTVAK